MVAYYWCIILYPKFWGLKSEQFSLDKIIKCQGRRGGLNYNYYLTVGIFYDLFLLVFRCYNMTLHKVLAINTYQLFYYDFLKFLVKGVLSTTTIFKNINQQISDFSQLLHCARAIILKFGIFLLKGRGGRNYLD